MISQLSESQDTYNIISSSITALSIEKKKIESEIKELEIGLITALKNCILKDGLLSKGLQFEIVDDFCGAKKNDSELSKLLTDYATKHSETECVYLDLGDGILLSFCSDYVLIELDANNNHELKAFADKHNISITGFPDLTKKKFYEPKTIDEEIVEAEQKLAALKQEKKEQEKEAIK